MILSQKLVELMPEDYLEQILAFDQEKDLTSLFNIEIGKYFSDQRLKQAISEVSLDYLDFPQGFRWPILSNETSFALVYLESLDKPQSLKQQNLSILVDQYRYSLLRINKVLLELESLEESYRD